MSLYDLKDLYRELKNDPMCREKILEYYRTTDLEEKDGDQSSLLHIAAEYGDSCGGKDEMIIEKYKRKS